MSEKKRYPAADAWLVAKELVAALTPHCARIEVAGSLRRGKPEVGDVEILYVSKTETRQNPCSLLTDPVEYRVADEVIEIMLARGVLTKRPSKSGVLTWGPENKLAIHVASGIPVDLFATTESGWFRSLVIRTGPKDFNLRLIEGAKKRGFRLHAYGPHPFTRITSGEPFAARSEAEVLQLCGMEWIEPKDRK